MLQSYRCRIPHDSMPETYSFNISTGVSSKPKEDNGSGPSENLTFKVRSNEYRVPSEKMLRNCSTDLRLPQTEKKRES